jgi:hypothetical protein
MTDYTKSTNFATKDNLSSGNALKIVKGTEIDTEFNNIATAIATKADLASPAFTGSPSLPTGTTGVTQSSGNNSTAMATTAFVQAALAAMYPVGSIYTNASVSTNPATLLGFGTWSAFAAGRVMVGLDAGNAAFDTVEETGGSADAITVSHTHTFSATSGAMSTNASHVHNIQHSTNNNWGSLNYGSYNNANALQANATTDSTNIDHTHSVSGTTASTGSSATNANLQPYITVYMWKRTA